MSMEVVETWDSDKEDDMMDGNDRPLIPRCCKTSQET